MLHQRVQSRGGLVQQEELGLGRERRDERDLLTVALGVRAGLLRRVQIESLHELIAPLTDYPSSSQ